MNNDDFEDRDIPEQEDFHVVLDQLLRETYAVIGEANGYIDRQEDGPFTMRVALRDIKDRVSAIEAETWYLTGALDRFQAIVAKLLAQRDEAIRQRDLLMLIAWSDWEESEDAAEDEAESKTE